MKGIICKAIKNTDKQQGSEHLKYVLITENESNSFKEINPGKCSAEKQQIPQK